MASCPVCHRPIAEGALACDEHQEDANPTWLRARPMPMPVAKAQPQPADPAATAVFHAPELPPPAPSPHHVAELAPNRAAEQAFSEMATAAFRLPAQTSEMKTEAFQLPPEMLGDLAPTPRDVPRFEKRGAQRSVEVDTESPTARSLRPVQAAAPLEPTPVTVARAHPAPRPVTKAGYIGRVFGGRFEAKTFLGSGGFGSTYVALDQRLKRECVIKIMRPLPDHPSALDLEMHRRFANEAVTLAHLVHPNITQVFDHGEDGDGTCWIAMEFVQGRPLSAVGREERQVDALRVANIGAQVASALAFAHSRGIVHRDLKPDNVLVVDDPTGGEQVKVLDFGIARITNPEGMGLDDAAAKLTQVGAFLGTPAFMSPEQAEGAQVGPESDVYSLGVVLYLLTCGVLPGEVPPGWNPLTTLAYVQSAFQPVRKLAPSCPPVLAELVEAMLEKNPRQRTLSAAQAAQELATLQPTTHQQAGRRAPAHRQRSFPMGLLAGGAIVVALAAIVALLLTRRTVTELSAPPVVAAAPAPAAPTPAQTREAQIAELLRRARGGETVEEIDREALRLGGDDARLLLARGIARKIAKDYPGALVLFEEAQKPAPDSVLGREAETQKTEALALQQAAELARAKAAPAVQPAKAEHKAEPRREQQAEPAERPDY